MTVTTDSIRRIEAYDNYVKVYFSNQRWLVRTAMATLESRLQDQGFLRVLHSMIVNVKAITALRGRTLILEDEAVVRVGPRYQKNLQRSLASIA